MLGLGSEARINDPSTVGCNWQWRALPGFDSPALAQRLHRQMELYERLPQAGKKSEAKAEAQETAESEAAGQGARARSPQADGSEIL